MSSTAGAAARKKILVIEDDPVGLVAVRDYLTAHGYDVHTATNGVDGLELAQLVDPDLVLCDILLPKKSGFEVCFELKRPSRAFGHPVVLMSAILSGENEQTYARRDLHADGYLVKPFSMKWMLARIEALLS